MRYVPRCEASTSDSTPTDSTKKLAVLKASKQAAQPVRELQHRTLGMHICNNISAHRHARTAEYMTLPASQYSVLDANRIERLSDTTFRCYVGGLKFLNFVVEPVLTVSVEVGEHGPTVRLLSTKVGALIRQVMHTTSTHSCKAAVLWRASTTALTPP